MVVAGAREMMVLVLAIIEDLLCWVGQVRAWLERLQLRFQLVGMAVEAAGAPQKVMG